MKQRHIHIIIGLLLLLCCPLQSWSKVTLNYQYWIDNNSAAAVSGTADGGVEISIPIDVGDLSPGVHFYNVRAEHLLTGWGTVYRTLFLIPETNTASAAGELQQYEYWLDNEYANRTVTDCTGTEQTPALTVDVSSISDGVHFFSVRALDANGHWGTVTRTLFSLPAAAEATAVGELAQYEYWIDDDYDNRTTTECTGSEATPVLTLDVSTLEAGSHYLNVRAQDANGEWGVVERTMFSITSAGGDTEAAELAKYEYWIDNDYENRVAADCSGSEASPSLTIDVSSLSPGVHFYNVRAQDANGVWGTVERTLFSVTYPAADDADKTITGYHYAFSAEGYDFPTESATITGAGEAYELNKKFTVALPASAPAVDDNCQFMFDTDFNEATMTRSVKQSFWIAFDAADGETSIPVFFKDINYSTSDIVEWTEMTVGSPSEFLPVPDDLQPFSVVQFTIDEAMTYMMSSDVLCCLRVYRPDGTLVDKCDAETLLNGWRHEWAAGTYYAVAFGNDEEATLSIEEFHVPVIQFVDPTVEALCVENWDTSGEGDLDIEEAAAVTDIGTIFQKNTTITSFNELSYFTSLESIGESAFLNCNALKEITLPAGIKSIGKTAFRNCQALTAIAVPGSVESIGDQAFYGCKGLAEATLAEGLNTIGSQAFCNCSCLESVTIPASVTSIAEDAYRNCNGLTSIKVEAGNTVYDSRNNCNAIIVSETNTLQYGCQNTLIPLDVTTIASEAFYNNASLKEIIIPAAVNDIGANAFRGCSALTMVIARNPEPVAIGENTFSNRKNATLYVPKASFDDYKDANYWKDFNPIIGYEVGDANGDGKVTITDAVAVVNYILGNASAGFVKAAADVNQDGNITITDAVGVVNIILNSGGEATAPPMEAPAVEAPEVAEPE